MVIQALEHGIKPAGRVFHTTPATVRKWLYRFKAGSFGGLEDLSRKPHTSPFQTPQALKAHLIQLKHKYKRLGAEQIKILEDLPISTKTMRKIWHPLKDKKKKTQNQE